MNKALAALLLTLLSLGINALSQEPRLTQQGISQLETNAGRAIVWHWFWWKGESLAKIRKQIAVSKPISYSICLGENKEPVVYLDTFYWKVTFTDIGGQYYDFDVEDYKALTRGDEAEAKRSYKDALEHDSVIKKGILPLSSGSLSILAFQKPGERGFSQATNTLGEHLLSPRRLKILRKEMLEEQLHNPLAVHVGGVSAESPWLYYYLEGMPYVGMMLFDPHTGKLIHDDLIYIHDTPREAEFKNIRRMVDKSGTKFLISVKP